MQGEVVGGAAVAALVGLLGAGGEGLVLGLFVAGGVAEAVVFAFRVVGGGVVEGWEKCWFRFVWRDLLATWCMRRVGVEVHLPLPPRRVEGDIIVMLGASVGQRMDR